MIQNFEKTNFHFNQLNCSCFFDQPCPCHVKQTLRMPRNSISSCRSTWHSRMQHLSPNSHLNLLKAFLNAFQTITSQFGQTIIAVTHDHDFAKGSNRIVELADGKIISNNKLIHWHTFMKKQGLLLTTCYPFYWCLL